MPRLLALEWDNREARLAVARTRGKEAVVEHAFTVELSPREGGDPSSDASVGQQIAAALEERRIGRCETLVAVGRSSIELRRLSLPPAPPEELPDLVRFQAMRDFAGVGEDWPLDFVPLEGASAEAGEAGGSVGVLAAVIAPKLVEQIRRTCEAADLTPQRLVLRPFAAASLLRRARPSEECRLLVDLLSDEADLTVLIGGNVVFVRTVRLPAIEGEAQTRALVGEARRTIAAAQNQLGGRRVERIVICGEPARIQAVQPQVQEQLAIPVEPFDPFSAAELDASLRADLPDYPGRFAPLLGMILDEAAQAGHDIDFLNPRRRPEPPSRRRQAILIGATAATAVLAGVFLIWLQLDKLDQKIRSLQQEARGLDKQVEHAQSLLAKVEEIDEFVRGDIVWLDELRRLSEKAPPGEQLLLAQLRANSLPAGGGQIILNGFAKDSASISALVENLNDPQRQVRGRGGYLSGQRSDYPWRFDNTTIVVPPTDPEEQLESGEQRVESGESRAESRAPEKN